MRVAGLRDCRRDGPESTFSTDVGPPRGASLLTPHAGVEQRRDEVLQLRPRYRGKDRPDLVVRVHAVPRLRLVREAGGEGWIGRGREEIFPDAPAEHGADKRERSLRLCRSAARQNALEQAANVRTGDVRRAPGAEDGQDVAPGDTLKLNEAQRPHRGPMLLRELAFSVLTGVRPMNELLPLDRAGEAYGSHDERQGPLPGGPHDE